MSAAPSTAPGAPKRAVMQRVLSLQGMARRFPAEAAETVPPARVIVPDRRPGVSVGRGFPTRRPALPP
ncbi:MAG: hypothetical protein J0M16_06450, partial [Gammaproteobacteria bacterium]|nr:hypothetical protein [Gammaproteobacteria bacterium]